MKVRYHPKAVVDLEEIFEWIADDDPRIARAVVKRILDGIDRLAEFPQMGRIGQVPDTREWVVMGLPYIVVYEVDFDDQLLEVIAVFHGARQAR